MWFLLGLLVGASIRFEPSTGPCSLAEVAPRVSDMPPWAFVLIFAGAALVAVPVTWAMFGGAAAQAAMYHEQERRARAEAMRFRAALNEKPPAAFATGVKLGTPDGREE